MTTGGAAASAPLRRANRLPMASTRSSSPASRHQRAKSSRPSRSAAVSVTRRTPPLGVAPMRASSISEDQRRSLLMVGVFTQARIPLAQQLGGMPAHGLLAVLEAGDRPRDLGDRLLGRLGI